MSLAVRLGVDPVRSLAFGVIGGAYMGIGTTLVHPARMLSIQNFTDVPLMFSFDGINDHLPLPTNGYIVLDIQSNKGLSQEYLLAAGSRIYVKTFAGAPTQNGVYVTIFYGAE